MDEELKAVIQRMIDAGETEENINSVIEFYESKKASGVVEMDATVTPEPAPVSESMDLESEDISLEQYDAMTPAEKKKIKNYKLKQKLIRESAAKRKNEKKETKETEETIKEEALEYNKDYNRKWGAWKSGNISLGEFLSSVPETLYNLGAIPQNLAADPKNYPLALQPLAYKLKTQGYLPEVQTAQKFKKQYGIKNSLLDYYREEKEKIQKKNAFYDKNTYEYSGAFDSFKNGKIDEGFSQLANGVIESAPVSISMMVGGAGVNFAKLATAGTLAMTDAELQEQRKNNPEQSEVKNMLKALGLAGAEMVFESVNKGALGQAYKTIIAKEGKEKGIKLFRDGVIKMYQKALIKSGAAPSIIGGGLEEVGTQITQNLINGKDPYEGVADAFLLGVGSGGFYGAPINVAQGASLIKDGITNVKVNKILKNTDYNSIYDAFSTDVPNETQIKLSQLSNGANLLDRQVKRKIAKNEITEEQGNKIRLDFRETQGVINTLKPLGLDLEIKSTPRLVELIKKQSKLEQVIKEVDNKALTQEESVELKAVNKEISEVKKEIQDLAVESRTSKITKGADIVGKEVKTLKRLKSFDTKEQIDKEISRLVDKGFIKEKNKESISNRAGENYGVILKNKETGEQRILINKTIAKEDGVMTTGLHEVSHAIVDRLISEDAQAETALGDGVLKELQNNKNVTFINQQTGEAIPIEETNFYKRFLQYKEKYSDAEAFGEIIPLLSEALMPPLKGLNAEIQINETAAMKIGDIFRRLLQSVGINLNFNSGKDVLNFVRDYNRSVETEGKGKKAIRKISEKAKVSDKLKQGGETIVYNASPKSFDELGKRTGLIFLATDINEAKEYARNNGGDVKEIIVQNDALANEQQVLNKLKELNVDVSEGLLYEMIDPRFEDFYIGKQKVDQLKKELEKDGFKGFRYKDGSQLSNKGTESIAILDKSSIKPSERVLVTEADWNKANEEQRVELLLQAYKDPDDVDGLQFEEFKDLPDVATSNMYIDPEINEIRNSARFKEASDEVQRLFDEKPRDWEMKVIEEFRPITSKLVERRRGVQGFDRQLLMDEIETGKRGIYDLIQAYDPSKGVPLSAYIMSQLNNRMQEVSERNLEKYFTKDVTEERGVAATEDAISIEESVDESITPTAKEKLNLRKKIKLPDEQVEKVRQAVRKTFGTKLPPPDSPQFKKALRKAFDTELFKELKTNVFKARKDYEFFMSQNWKALYDAIPQETLNQSFAPFREAVLDETGKQRREKTPEGERIFRKKNITKEEFLDYFFSPDLGVSTRGTRKDAIVRMMAQELGFDAIMETIQEPKVAEKTKFVNPKITPQKIAPKVDRAIDEKFSERFKKDIIDFVQGLEIDFDNKKRVEETKVLIGNVVSIMGETNEEKIQNAIDFVMPMVTRGYYFKEGENKRKILFKGRSDFFSYMASKNEDGTPVFPNNPFANAKWKAGDTDVIVNNKSYKLRNITSQSTRGVTSGSFQKTIKKREESTLNQRRGLRLMIDQLKTLLNEDFEGNKNAVAMYLATLTSNVDALVRTAAMPTDIFLIEGLIDSDYVYEHSKTAYDTRSQLAKLVFNKNISSSKEIDDVFNGIMQDYTVAIIPKGYDRIINKNFSNRGPRVANDDLNPKTTKRGENIDPLPAENTPSRYLYSSKLFNNAGLLPLSLNKINEKKVIHKVKKEDLKKYQAKPSKKTTEINIKASERKKSSFFAKMIEEKTGILAKQKVSAVRAAKMADENRKIDYFIAPSAEDFMGLMYKLLGKGKLGDKQKEWVNKNIMRPYAIGIEKITTARNVVTNSFQTIKKDLNITEKDLKKKIPNSVFTQEDALRVYIWAKQGLKIPGLLKKEQKELVSYINGKSNLVKLANNIIKINNVEFKTPTSSWQVGNLGTDMLESLNTTRRAEYLEEWQNNVDDIFSENNLNKLEAAFGKPYKLAVENSLQRMKTGRNRDVGRNNLVNRFVDWTNGATGAIMFFNTRSAILQLISAGNFINFGDNNIVAAGKAFANQKQYWSDVSMLFNSEFLVNRRDGLKMSVNEADIADVAREQGVRGLINKLLKLGFTPTQVADSIAIATGGATFYRNRYNALVKSGMNKADANAQAMRDFRETAEESQQSSRPDKISQQQASELGRLILAFANTPSQYARIIKKAALDLKNRRGSDKENVSKILYYTFAQNLIFNALQNAMFAVAFGDVDDEDKLKKEIRVANGMADSLLRGMGIQGAILSIVKNAAIRIYKQEYGEILMELFRISPPISSKVRKIERASNLMKWEGDEIFEQGLTLDNPAIEITGKTVEALTNLPLDRAIRKITNLKDATDSELEFYQRLALTGGWNKWDLGIQDKKEKNKRTTRKRTTRKRTTRQRITRN